MKNNIEHILRIILYIIITGIVIYLGINLFIFLLPFLLIIGIGYYLYITFFKGKFKQKVNKNKSNNIKKTTKSIKNKIEEAEIIEEKFDK